MMAQRTIHIIHLLLFCAGAFAGHVGDVRGYHQNVAAPVPAQAVAHEPLTLSQPKGYRNDVPAAAIRNIETVDVKKSITPVITRTLTQHRYSEPALSIGHIRGHTEIAHGSPKVAEVHYNTHYTQYLNPTVGVNGPVTYAGPATGEGIAISQGFAPAPAPISAPVQSIAPQPVTAYISHNHGHQFGFSAAHPHFLNNHGILIGEGGVGLVRSNLVNGIPVEQPTLFRSGHSTIAQPIIDGGGIRVLDLSSLLSSVGYFGTAHLGF